MIEQLITRSESHPRNPRPLRLRNGTAVFLLLASFIFCGFSTQASVATPTPESDSRLYIAHLARFVANIPAAWRVAVHDYVDYVGEDGFVVSQSLSASTLAEACAEAEVWFERYGSVPETIEVKWRGRNACRLDGDISLGPAATLVVPHLQPFERGEARTTFVSISADPAHIDQIAATIDFDPERVPPDLFTESVIELVKARGHWSSDVDWSIVRQQALEAIAGTSTLDEAQSALKIILFWLKNAGDNHSYLIEKDEPSRSGGIGYGFLVVGNRVMMIYENGPAHGAGLQIGDLIIGFNGTPFIPSKSPIDPFGVGSALFSVQRDGIDELIEVLIEPGSYDRFAALPWGGPLPFATDVALIGVPSRVRDISQDFVAEGNQIISDAVDACGWIVDLRLNIGGNYSPMIGAVMPLLGNGVFGGFRFPDGTFRQIELKDGVIVDGGMLVADHQAISNAFDLSDRPIAVLIGPGTASAGEVTTLAFVNHPTARLFGEPTAGLTTGIAGGYLFDGSVLGLAGTAMTDRTGLEFPDGVPPDVIVITDWQQFGTEDDPVLTAAVDWLHDQPGCAS